MICGPNKLRLILCICMSIILASCSNEVNYTAPEGSSDMAITHFSYDKLVIDDEIYDIDIIILPNSKITGWGFDRETHRIRPDDLLNHITEDVKTVIIGCGLHGEGFLDDEAVVFLKKLETKGLSIHFVDTIEAVNLFNTSSKEGLVTFLHVRN